MSSSLEERAHNAPFQTVTESGKEHTDLETSQFSSTVTNLLAGLTGSLSMVPEALAFSVIAGVSPVTGLQSAAVLSIVASLTGAQPGSVSGAAGATAVVVGGLTASKGPEYLYAAVILAGGLQVRLLASLLSSFSGVGRRSSKTC